MKRLILDLDNTLFHAMTHREMQGMNPAIFKKYKNYHCGGFRIFERPYLSEFLNYAFDNFDVDIWSMGTKNYVDSIIPKVFHSRGLFPQSVLSREDCKRSNKKKKHFKKVSNNSILLDDNFNNVFGQRKNAILAPSFDLLETENYGDDTFLMDLVDAWENKNPVSSCKCRTIDTIKKIRKNKRRSV
jgi:hypothetical protein